MSLKHYGSRYMYYNSHIKTYIEAIYVHPTTYLNSPILYVILNMLPRTTYLSCMYVESNISIPLLQTSCAAKPWNVLLKIVKLLKPGFWVLELLLRNQFKAS